MKTNLRHTSFIVPSWASALDYKPKAQRGVDGDVSLGHRAAMRLGKGSSLVGNSRGKISGKISGEYCELVGTYE